MSFFVKHFSPKKLLHDIKEAELLKFFLLLVCVSSITLFSGARIALADELSDSTAVFCASGFAGNSSNDNGTFYFNGTNQFGNGENDFYNASTNAYIADDGSEVALWNGSGIKDYGLSYGTAGIGDDTMWYTINGSTPVGQTTSGPCGAPVGAQWSQLQSEVAGAFGNTDGNFVQNLGSGFSGTLGNIELMIKGASDSGSADPTIGFLDCGTSSCTLDNLSGLEPDSGSSANYCLFTASDISSADNSLVDFNSSNEQVGFDWNCGQAESLDPTHYYAIFIIESFGFSTAFTSSQQFVNTIYGTSAGTSLLWSGSPTPYTFHDPYVGTTIGAFYYVLSTGVSHPSGATTYFVSLTPANGSIISSTTDATIGAQVYISPADYVSGMDVTIGYNNFASTLSPSIADAFTSSTNGEIVFPITQSGLSVLSTTTPEPLAQGTTTLIYILRSPNLLFGFNASQILGYQNFIQAQSSFTVGSQTYAEGTMYQLEQAVADTFLTGSSTVPLLSSQCNPIGGDFDLPNCLLSIVVPQPQVWTEFSDQFYNQVLVRAPWGYMTLAYTIITTTSSSTLPSLAITIPAIGASPGASFDFTPWNKLLGPGSYLSTATSTVTGTTFMASFLPWWDDAVYAVFAFAVVAEFLKVTHWVQSGVEDYQRRRYSNKKKV